MTHSITLPDADDQRHVTATFFPHEVSIECSELGDFENRIGVMLQRERIRELRDELSAWLGETIVKMPRVANYGPCGAFCRNGRHYPPSGQPGEPRACPKWPRGIPLPS